MTTNIATITPTAMPTPSLLLLAELLAVGGSVTGMSKTKVNVTTKMLHNKSYWDCIHKPLEKL